MKWRETGHDALRCVWRIVLLHAALAVHAILHMHHWYGTCILSSYECPEDRRAKGVGAGLSARQFCRPEAARDRLVGHRSQDSVGERPVVAQRSRCRYPHGRWSADLVSHDGSHPYVIGQCHALLSTGESTHELDCTKGKEKGEGCRKDEAENDHCGGAVL